MVAIVEKITKTMTLGEIVSKFPKAADVIMRYGLHCVGCHVAYSETLEQGALAHGLTESDINRMVMDANKAISSGKKA